MRKRNDSRGELATMLNKSPLLLTLVAAGLGFLLITAKGCSKSAPEDNGMALAPSIYVPVDNPTEKPDPTDRQPVTTDSGAIDTEDPATSEAPTAEPTDTLTLTDKPTDTPTELPPETAAPTEAPTEAPVEKQFTTVDESYFSDALFLGDSRTDGLCLYSPVGDAKHYSSQSLTIFKIMDTTDPAYGYNGARALLKGQKFGKIYIMYGINEAGYNTDVWAAKYAEVIAEIRALQPDALIYIQSILYVTQKHEAKYPVFATAGLKEKNERLKALANGQDIFYLEVNDVLNDGTDHLPSDYTGDGAHLKAKYYHLWKDYLLTHAIVDEAHPA